MSCSPRDQALLPPSSAEQGFVTARLGRRNSANLTPASGRQDHTILPSAATSLVSVPVIAHGVRRTRPADPIARKTLLCVGRDNEGYRADLGQAGRELFLQMGLDWANHIDLFQQFPPCAHED